ncbi:MAG: hypothetical protein K2N63_02250 [Lachnospiraceae bacterium]|nr:hypothetical protein [Lachnospiraceae bacterium]
MYAHLRWYPLSNWQLLFMLLGVLLAFITGKLLNKKRKVKKALTLFFAIAVFALDYFSYVPGWSWVVREHPTWSYFKSWHDLFSFFELIFLPFDIGFLLSWIGYPIMGGKKKNSAENT